MSDGEGIYTWPNGAEYFGEWKSGTAQGRGAFVWPSGAAALLAVLWCAAACLYHKEGFLLYAWEQG